MKKIYLMLLAGLALVSCNCRKPNYASVDEYPVKRTSVKEMVYSPKETSFTMWSPNADSVIVSIYASQSEMEPVVRRPMTRRVDGAWETSIVGDWKGYFYTFLVRQSDTKWELKETPGIFAVAVGVNGHRAAIVDMAETNPEKWAEDKRPELNKISDAIVYEMHHRDFSIHPSSGINHRGKFIALTEEGTMTKDGQPTGIDHLKQLGVTHVQILPSYDYGSIDETQLALNRYNWGYDPVNYNVPDGSYSTDPYDPICRIKEFKQMVHALHAAGIRVILEMDRDRVAIRKELHDRHLVPTRQVRRGEDDTACRVQRSAAGDPDVRNPMRRARKVGVNPLTERLQDRLPRKSCRRELLSVQNLHRIRRTVADGQRALRSSNVYANR